MEKYQELEKKFAEWVGVEPENMVVCSSGTAALHLSLEALQLPLGSKVLVPDFTMVACARAVTLAGLTSVFVDCGPDLLIDPTLIPPVYVCEPSDCDVEIRAVIPVHVYGRQCDMANISALAGRYGLVVIEDLAEAHGIRPHEDTDAACWSFYKNKVIAGEEGGAVWFHDVERADFARSLRCLGFTSDHDFRHVPRGHNYRMSNLHAGVIIDHLAHVNHHLHQRRLAEEVYDSAPNFPLVWQQPPRDVVWVYDIRIEGMTSEQQDRVVKNLRAEGIEARHGFKPMSMQEEYKGCERIGDRREAEKASREVIYLPCSPGLVTDIYARKCFDVIKGTLRKHFGYQV